MENLQERYRQRRNEKILSMVKFLCDPVGYQPGDGCLEMADLRMVVKETCERLFPEGLGNQADQDQEEGPSNLHSEELSYKQKLSQQFDALLDKIGAVATPQVSSKLKHIEEEMALASKTGELTSKLSNLHKAVMSIPASSIESERAFSVASRFVTKIRSRLGDATLDNFAFAKSKLRNDKRELVIILLVFIFIQITKLWGEFYLILFF